MKSILRILIFLLAIAFIVLGAKNGGARRTMNKGNMVCLECVGIG